MTEQVFARALILAGELEEQQQEKLRILCGAYIAVLEAQLKDGLTAENCGENFLTAASFLALEAMGGIGTNVQEFKAGDLTVKTGSAENRDLKRRAEALMAPYLKGRFLFTGV